MVSVKKYINIERFQNSLKILGNLLIYDKDISEIKYSDPIDLKTSEIVKKLINGYDNLKEEEIYFLTGLIDSRLRETVFKRWKGIIEVYNNNLSKALEFFNESLELAKIDNIDKQFIKDILIDIRNIEHRYHRTKGIFKVNESLKKEIESIEETDYEVYKYMYESYDSFQSELFDYSTDSPYTIRFGGKINNSLDSLNRALLISIFEGDHTFFHIIRNNIAFLLYDYYKIYKIPSLLYKSLKLFIIEDNIKAIKRIFDSEWENLYEKIIKNPNDLIEFIDQFKNTTQKKIIKCIVIERIGDYIYDENIKAIEKFLLDCLKKKSSLNLEYDIKRNCIRAIIKIIDRVNINKILPKIISSISDNYWVRDEIIRILPNIDWSNIRKENIPGVLNDLFAFRENVHNKEYLYITFNNIKNIYPDLIKKYEIELHKSILNKDNYYAIFYFSLSKYTFTGDDLYKILKHLLKLQESQNKKLEKDSSIEFGGFPLMSLITNYFINNELTKFAKDVEAIFKEILLNPYQSLQVKINCVDNLIVISDVKNEEIKNIVVRLNTVIKRNYKEVFKFKDAFIPKIYNESLQLKLFKLRLEIEKPRNINFIISKCVEYSLNPFMDVRLDALSVVESIINKRRIASFDSIIQLLYSKTFDDWFRIRAKAIVLLLELCLKNVKWEDICLKRAEELLNDPFSYVRYSIISMFEKNKKIFRNNKYHPLLRFAQNDLSFKIRKRAQKLVNEFIK